MNQLALDFERAKEQGPSVSKFHVDAMLSNLRGRGWQTSRQLGAATEADKRILRAIANGSEGQIISGQKGYKLTLEATVTEIDVAAAWLKHQGEEMIRRYTEIQRVRHRHFAGGVGSRS